MKTGVKPESWSRAGASWANYYTYSSAAILVVMGLLMWCGAAGGRRSLRQILAGQDALLGVSHHTLLIVAGVIHVLLGIYLCWVRDPWVRGTLPGWVGLNDCVYRWGLVWMRVAVPCPCVQAVSQKMGLAPDLLDAAWQWVVGYLLIGSAGMLLSCGYRRRQGLASGLPEKARPAANAEFRFSCPLCGQHLRAGPGYVGRNILCPTCTRIVRVADPPLLKVACPYCQGHLEYPAPAAGQKWPCPHCAREITLSGSAGDHRA